MYYKYPTERGPSSKKVPQKRKKEDKNNYLLKRDACTFSQ